MISALVRCWGYTTSVTRILHASQTWGSHFCLSRNAQPASQPPALLYGEKKDEGLPACASRSMGTQEILGYVDFLSYLVGPHMFYKLLIGAIGPGEGLNRMNSPEQNKRSASCARAKFEVNCPFGCFLH
ncbi:hypothetical protein ABW19_dt0201974 [Dactylella cylindrospora]|nr:hypothetical protein ABW19_dt0201974 [Dactylella cylindrospora]